MNCTILLVRINAMLERYKRGSTRPDFFSYLIQEDGQLQPGMAMKDLDADVWVAIMAGMRFDLDPCFWRSQIDLDVW